MDSTGDEVATTRLPRGRTSLNRDAVIDAAIDDVDRHGLAGLTMRNLGTELGVRAMSLYRYVDGREDLLEGVVDRLVDSLHLDPADTTSAGDGWQGYQQWLAHAVRRIAVAHPRAFPLIASRHPSAPWLRPPLRSLVVVEDFMQALLTRGFDPERAVLAYRAFSSFLLGNLLLEAAVRGAETGPAQDVLDEGGAAVPHGDGEDPDAMLEPYPALRQLRALLSEDHAEEEFEEGLEALLDRLDRLVSQ